MADNSKPKDGEQPMRRLFRTKAGQDWMTKALEGTVDEQTSEALQDARRWQKMKQDRSKD